jgi:hypothetical protein
VNFWFKAILYVMLAYRFLPASVTSKNVIENPEVPPTRYSQRLMSYE